jgi:hypothetical protein
VLLLLDALESSLQSLLLMLGERSRSVVIKERVIGSARASIVRSNLVYQAAVVNHYCFIPVLLLSMEPKPRIGSSFVLLRGFSFLGDLWPIFFLFSPHILRLASPVRIEK